LNEHADAGWYLPEECVGLTWSPADIPILEDHIYSRK